jgi:hypothetical protein
MKLRSRELIISGIILVFTLFLPLFVTPAHAVEPSLAQILENLGFTNIAQSSTQTFPTGTYNITCLQNLLDGMRVMNLVIMNLTIQTFLIRFLQDQKATMDTLILQ